MRHSVELRLKGVCNHFIELSSHRGRLEEFDLKGSHDIGRIWRFIKNSSAKIDSRFKLFIELLDRRVTDIAEIDSTGQTFRYPDDNENVKHLVDVSLINLKVLSRRFAEIESLLDCLEYFCDDLIKEYSYGTYTSKLSRDQLMFIGGSLPPKDKWGSEEFQVLIKDLKARYNLSNNDFNRAVCKIKSHYGAAPALEPPKLFGLDFEGLSLFFDAWFQFNDKKYLNDKASQELADLESDNSIENFFEEIEARARIREEIWANMKDFVNVDWLSSLKALYDCHNSRYSEEYIRSFDIIRRTLNNKCAKGEGELADCFFDFLWKPRAIVYILKGLYLVGHKECAEKLISHYGLEENFGWIEDARSGKLFLPPFRSTLRSLMQVIHDIYVGKE